MEYSSEVRRRLASPGRRGVREADGATVTVRATAEDRSLNVWVSIEVEMAQAAVASVRYEAYGCPHFIAAVDWVAEHLEDQPAGALAAPIAREAVVALEVPTEKLGKLLVIEDALAACAAQAGSAA